MSSPQQADAHESIYLDHHATTPVDERVLEEMKPYFTEVYGNPASDDHIYGAEAKRAVNGARSQLGSAFGCRDEEIIFTSGATESDNLAIQGAAKHARARESGNHIITAQTEHEAVLETCEALELEGFEVTYLSVDEYGRVDPADILTAINEDTVLISIMAANNEIGTIAPIEKIGAIAKERDVLFHTDAVQAVGYLPLELDELGIDLMSVSAHKIYGPKGVGALYVRRRRPKVKLEPIVHGGGHERGWRSGTLNVPGIVGLGRAVNLAESERETRSNRLESLSTHLWERLSDELDEIVLNGHPEQRIPNNLNVSFLGVENKGLVKTLQPEISVSAGSACATGTVEPSYVLQAISDDEARWHSSIRFGLGKDSTQRQLDQVVDLVSSKVSSLRSISL